MAEFQLTTPVAFLIFNRPDTTARVFEAIRQAKPPKLLVVADGPRLDRPNDVEKCKAARAIIDGVDWDCEVLTNYSDVNLGGNQRISGGLNWVFKNVEKAIILEDDCLPHNSFFRFCEDLLEYYQSDQRIMLISGNNFQFGRQRTKYSYYFSCYNSCWGWATWQRAWRYYDINIKLWPEIRDQEKLESILQDSHSVKYWTKLFEAIYDKKITFGWDYRWTFACWSQNGLTITPKVNLVSNIGFRKDASHTFDDTSIISNVPAIDIEFPLNHPPYIVPHAQADKFTFKTYYYHTLFRRISKKIKRIPKKINKILQKNIIK